MNVVVIPTFGRPGFLAVTLGQIASAKKFKEHFYLFAVDLGFHTGILQVINQFVQMYDVEYAIIHPPKRYSKPGKQSFNIINAYREAVKLEPELVYLIEEDVFIADDFFLWHEAVQIYTLQVSIAAKNNNADDPTVNDLSKFYLKTFDYQSLGVCWDTAFLKFVLHHIEEWYFERPVEYCTLKFPDSKVGQYFAEQDGLIRRILELYDEPIAYPHVPRCFHAGFEGYNRFGKETLPERLDEQIEMIRRICFNPEAMKANTYHPEHYYDSMPINLRGNSEQWTAQIFQSLYQLDPDMNF